jgi:hypothetical protein
LAVAITAESLRRDLQESLLEFTSRASIRPRSFAEQVSNIQRRTEMPRGGHLAALEAPGLLPADVTTFFGALRGR